MSVPQTTPYQPKIREMIVYLEDHGFRVTRKMSEKHIHDMYNITFGTSQPRAQRLAPGAPDCFGDFRESMVADCRLPNQDCCLMDACKRMTTLQQEADRIVEKEAKKSVKKAKPPAAKKSKKKKARKKKAKKKKADTNVDGTPGKKKDTYGFVAGSKLSQTVMFILADRDKYTLDEQIKRAAKELKDTEANMKQRWWKAKNVLVKERGYKIETDDAGKIILESPE